MATRRFTTALASMAAAALMVGGASLSAADGPYKQKIGNDMSRCAPGKGSAVLVTITNVSASQGKVRVQAYNGTKADWLEKGRWLNRIELPARAGTMRVCMPVPGPGTYGIAVRHDLNGNGKTDLTSDGGGMSNNPSINIFNLGKPSYTKTRFYVGERAERITIQMKYVG